VKVDSDTTNLTKTIGIGRLSIFRFRASHGQTAPYPSLAVQARNGRVADYTSRMPSEDVLVGSLGPSSATVSRKGTSCLAITRRRLQVRLRNRSWPASAPVVNVTIQSGRSQLRGLQVRMRKGHLLLGSISWFLLMFAGLAVSANAQPTALNEWTWVGGSHSVPQLGNYGTLGVAAAGNLPGSRESSSTWVDKNGNLWLFGGLGYYSIAGPQFLNDLWEYTPSTGFWTWQGGPQFGDQSGAYGTQGVPLASSIPGGRSGAAQWTDANGNFWLFGGLGYDAAGNAGYLNDLWEYNVTTSKWSWQGGSSLLTQFGNSYLDYGSTGMYGTQNVSASSNLPPGRSDAMYAVDATGNLWLFGGFGYSSSSSQGSFDDLWTYNISSKIWTWVSGSQALNQPVSYGTQGVPYDPSVHFPGCRSGGALWADNNGFLWLFGGILGDLWRIDTASRQVTWVSGSPASNGPGSYGIISVPATTNMPGAREYFAHWMDSKGNFWVFGGTGYDSSDNFGFLNDLWMFNPQSGIWTWENGSSSADLSGMLANYGTRGIPAITNEPGGLWLPMNWVDHQGNFWLYSGGATTNGTEGVILDDLWVYQPLALTLQSQTISFSAPRDVFSTTTSVLLSASTSSGLPVSFASNTPSVCSLSDGAAEIAASGTCSITAIQAGNSTYAAATPVTETFQVVPDFTVSVSGANSMTVDQGGPAIFNFAVAPVAVTNFPNAVTLSYSSSPTLPSGSQVTMTPTSITSGSPPTNVTLVLSTPTRAMQEQAPYHPTFRATAPLAVCLLLPIMGCLRQRGKQFSALTVLIFLLSGAALLSLDGCGGSSSASSGSPTSYEILVTATSGSLSHSSSVSLTVK
jgi:N-acetylneuraminic acid mutarotase